MVSAIGYFFTRRNRRQICKETLKNRSVRTRMPGGVGGGGGDSRQLYRDL